MTRQSTFPDIHSAVPTEVLRQVYEQAAPRLEQVLHGLTEDQIWKRARGPNRWSIGEIVFHLADSEAMAALRFRIVRAQPGAVIPTYDQNAFTSELRYSERAPELESALSLFAGLRRSTAGLMLSWESSDWSRTGEHPQWGRLTLRQLLEMYADHGERHLDQILENRTRQNLAVTLTSILSGRIDLQASAEASVGGGR